MRAFALFVALLAGSLLVAAVLTYPAWWLVSLISIEPVHRVMHRIAMLLALVGLVMLTRRLGLSDKESLGYGMPRRQFLRQMGIGFACGVGLMLPLTALLLGLDIREVKPELRRSVARTDRRRHPHRCHGGVHRRNILPRRACLPPSPAPQARPRLSSHRACCMRHYTFSAASFACPRRMCRGCMASRC